MLTPLQEQVASIIAGLAEAESFALAGGAALIARGEIQRETQDLDFFGLTPDDVDRLVPAVERALQEAGLVVRRVQASPGFARLIVENAAESTELDLGADARLFPVEPRRPVPTLAARSSLSTRSSQCSDGPRHATSSTWQRSNGATASSGSSSWPRRRRSSAAVTSGTRHSGSTTRRPLPADRAGRDRPPYAQRPRPNPGDETAEALLAAVPGISTTSARALLERFGTVAGVVAADPGEWLSVPGIGPERARALEETFTLRRNAGHRS